MPRCTYLAGLAAALLLAACTTHAPEQAYPQEAIKVSAAPTPLMARVAAAPAPGLRPAERPQGFNTEEYRNLEENPFLATTENPLSTFSIDVDTASYANVRRFLMENQLPPRDAVRLEELVNYFDYDYPAPEAKEPLAFVTELGAAPWNPDHRLLQIGLQARKVEAANLPPSNLVFLLDVSGSMDDPRKLPLVKSALKLLVEQLRPEDHVAIAVYAGAAGLVLPSTSGKEKGTILAALDNLQAGGSTAGGAGIELAYKTAQEHLLAKGNNRVILATDGDFNVGASSDSALVQLIEQKRKSGIFLTVLGFGMGNYKDSKMEQLADAGNGNYAYIDNLLEARKVLVEQMGGTLLTLAKDVKVQMEFNPAKVASYRLLGYENRLLRAEDFDNDAKDAGDMGAGHRVTVLYEIVPAKGAAKGRDLRYSTNQVKDSAATSDELGQIKFRYKAPQGDKSELLVHQVKETPAELSSANFRMAAAAAEWGMLLRDSAHKGKATFAQVEELARSAAGEDRFGYRHEFLRLVALSESIRKAEKR
jgi:Ca-activated chloride channel family protein